MKVFLLSILIFFQQEMGAVLYSQNLSAPDLDSFAFQQTSLEVGILVDSFKIGYTELQKERNHVNSHSTDYCQNNLSHSHNFAQRIGFFIQEMFVPIPSGIEGIAPYYHVNTQSSSFSRMSLVTHSLCPVTKKSLRKTIKKMPSSKVIQQANNFALRHNELRMLSLYGDYEATIELLKHWQRLFFCLGYKESLSTADSTNSYKVARKYAPSGYQKPEGVKFYEDPYQNEASKLNIGIFQFTPNKFGNISPCLRSWRKMYPKCQIYNEESFTPILGSSYQSFNAFCGVHKLVQTFSVQAHTTKRRNTHPENLENGKLKLPKKRCVTPHFYAGWAYNHFGPLMNSTGTNLGKLFKCIAK